MRRAIGLAAVVALLLFGGWLYLTRPEHKYRLTINVETPEGIKSASGVIAVYIGKDAWGYLGGSVDAKGDALFVDLGNGRHIVVALTSGNNGQFTDGPVYLAQQAFAAAGRKVAFKEVKNLSGMVPVTGKLIPTLVSFSDLNNPKSSRIVRPDDLQSAFGEGYRLQNVSLTLLPVGLWPFDFGGSLGEPVTRGIDRALPWIKTAAGYLSGKVGCDPRSESCVQVFHLRRR